MQRSTAHDRARRALVALVILTTAVSACSSGDDDDDAASTTTITRPATTTTTRPSDDVLTIGTLLPQTGALKDTGPAEFAGVDLALRDINDAGGVLGHDVAIVHGDSGDASSDLASQTVTDLLDRHVDAIVGPSSTAVTLTVMDRIAAADVIEVSPADHDDIASAADRRHRYFRTSAPMGLQAQLLAAVMADDGVQHIALVAARDPYGDAFSADLVKALARVGIQVAVTRHYDPKATSFGDDASAVAAAKPDGVVVIGFEESSSVLASLIDHHVGPQAVKAYGVDGNMQPTLAEGVPAGALSSMKGTVPLVDVPDAFRQRLLDVDGSLTSFDSSAESYDAVVLLALATMANDGDDAAGMARSLIDVSRRGTRCTTFAACAALLRDHKDVDYDGVSGTIDLDDDGDPTSASFGIRQFTSDGKLLTLEYRTAGQ
jgi:branched-chain amino acid transport system substrate-binding protein